MNDPREPLSEGVERGKRRSHAGAADAGSRSRSTRSAPPAEAEDPDRSFVFAVSLDRASAADLIARHLRDEIIDGILRPGAPLREATLAKRFDVSRNTVREAFRLLERDRLTSHQTHRGVEVRTLTADEVSDLYRMRVLLEPYGLRNALVSPLDPLRQAVATAEGHAARGDERQTLTADLAFHQAIVDLARSPRMSETFASLLVELRLVLSVLQSDSATYWLDENKRLLHFIELGNLDAAQKVLESYLRRSERDVLDRL